MTACETCQSLLSGFLDGELAPPDRGAVGAHLKQCAICQGVARDLERVRAAARDLTPIEPPDHIWLEVAGQIHLSAPRPLMTPMRPIARRFPIRQFAAMAAVLVLITIGVYVVGLMRARETGPAPGNAPAQTSVQTVAEELGLALEHYDKAIAQLQVLATDSNSGIDPTVAATLQRNLTVIDQAITESRAALTNEPQSEPARVTLMEALRQKVGLLQATVSLMNEMRKGDQDGAAAVMSGLGRKS